MNTHEQRSAIGAASAATSVAAIFVLIVINEPNQIQLAALALFSLSLPANLTFSLTQLNMTVEDNPRNSPLSTWSFWVGLSTLFGALTLSIYSASAIAAACLVIGSLVSLYGYGYTAKTDGRTA
uniref:hypothetical protein n=1 Tax=Pseudomonas sp. RW407 TaxID=2202894 RepID=UPI0011B52E3A|nr:hypothetical protein [Pseudomonas sp. RW407]